MPVWKKGQMFIGRENDIDLAVSLLLDGMSVDVIGSRGSGRTSFLRVLHIRLEELGRVVIHLRGTAALRSHPFAALSIAGFAATMSARGPSAIGDMAESIIATAGDRPAVVLVDDWDDLDDTSWGVIDSIRSSSGFPVVISRLRGATVRQSPAGAGSSSLEPTYLIELAALAFEPMQRILHERLGGLSDIKTAARIYSKSGGIVGLALHITDIAVKEERIVRGEDGRWVAVKELWSPALRSVLEGHLESLSPQERDAVHLLALIGVADVETARGLMDWGIVEMLEEIGLVQFTNDEDRQFLALTPPLIVDYIRHEPRTARHLRLTELIVERIGADSPLAVAAASSGSRALGAAPNNAVFSRMLHERIRSHRLLTEARWRARPEPAEAVEHIRFLLQSTAAHDVVQYVFDNTDMTTGDEQSHTDLQVMRAKWVAFAQRDTDRALQLLTVIADTPPDKAGEFTAAAVWIQASVSSITDPVTNALVATRPTATSARAAVIEARLYVAVIQGRFADARALAGEISALDPDRRRHISWALHAYALTGQGRVSEAIEVATNGMNVAHARLDLDALRVYGSAAVLAHIFVGDFDAVDRILDTLLATGDSYTLPRGYQISVLNVASVAALRRGDVPQAERYVEEISGLATPDGPLPGQDTCWSRAHLLVAAGQPRAAASEIWASSEALWDRGARFSAALGYISSLELDLDKQRYAHARSRIARVEGSFVHAAMAYIDALSEEDPDQMLTAARTLQASGRIALAIAAYRAATDLYGGAERPEEARLAREESDALLGSDAGKYYRSLHTSAAASKTLSEREKQVARYAADGLSNPEIAEILVLSVRTVESHMYRVLRKLDLSHRGELASIRSRL